MGLVGVDGEEFELAVVEERHVLCVDEDKTPEVRNKPRVDRVIAFVGRDEDFGHRGQQTLQAEFLEIFGKLWVLG